MKSKELYSIFEGDKLLYEDLTQDEYFNAMEDLAYEWYDNGSHNPNDLRTEIKQFNYGNQKRTQRKRIC